MMAAQWFSRQGRELHAFGRELIDEAAALRPRQRLTHGPMDLADRRARKSFAMELGVEVFEMVGFQPSHGHLPDDRTSAFDRNAIAIHRGRGELASSMFEPVVKHAYQCSPLGDDIPFRRPTSMT